MTCRICQTEKEPSEFGRCKTKPSGLDTRCKKCLAVYLKDWKRKNPDKMRAIYERYEARLRDNGTWHKRGRERCWKHHVKVQYDMSPGDYDRMVLLQGGECALCHRRPKRLFVDHDHITGKVRALLCPSCNSGLGHFGDDPRMLREAARFVEKHRENTGAESVPGESR